MSFMPFIPLRTLTANWLRSLGEMKQKGKDSIYSNEEELLLKNSVN